MDDMPPREAELFLRILAGQVAATAAADPREPSEAPPGAALAPAVPVASLTSDALRTLVEAVPDALVVANADGRIVFVNSQTEKLFGYRQDELLGHPIELLVPVRSRDKHVGQRLAYTANPHVRPMGKGLELSGLRKDGHEVPVEIGLSPLATEAGPLVVASIRDVTERRRAEGQLRKLEARYRSLVEGIPAVTFMAAMDEDANELYVSPQIEELLGFSQKEWLENPILWYTQLHPDDRARWHEEFARTVSTGERFRSVYRFLARDGRVVWVHGEAQVVRDADGHPLFLQGVAFDITGMKEAEENLRALNATLEERVAERTRELARSNKDLEALAYRISHDLQAPLRSISSYTQKLAESLSGSLGPEAEDWMYRVIKNATRQSRIIKSLLAFSRVGTHGKEFRPTDCCTVFDTVLDAINADLEKSEGAATAGPLPTVLADQPQIEQLFQNLIGNALKYRSEQPPLVHVSAERRGAEWLFSVTDNGIGVGADFLERIFKIGERLHKEKDIPGDGIGLAICTKIVERHGGRIWATSPGPGQGTTVWFTLAAVG